MLRINIMSEEDFDFAVKITDRMKWNLSRSDFEFMMELEPNGCFVLFEDSKRIGLATTVTYNTLAWFGNLIVDENHRNKGAGSLLVKHSIEYLMHKNMNTIGLYAYMDRIHFYQMLGFSYDSKFTVLKGKGCTLPFRSAVRRAQKQDVREIIKFDGHCFGASRRKLVEPIILDADNLCYVSFKEGRIVGYVAAKLFGKIGEIGPLMCQKDQVSVAIDLLNSVISKLEEYELLAYVSIKERSILDHLRKVGFTESFQVARMFFGPPLVSGCMSMAESLERG